MESFNGKLRDELLDREVFYTVLEVQVLTVQYRQTYNRIRPHSSLGYRPPAPETILPADVVPAMVGLTWRVVQPLGACQNPGWRPLICQLSREVKAVSPKIRFSFGDLSSH